MTSKCTTDYCYLAAKYEDKCALHCSKGGYQSDKVKGVLNDFYDQLAEYILAEHLTETYASFGEDEVDLDLKTELQQGGIEWPKERLERIEERKKSYIDKIKGDESKSISDALNKYPIVFQGIIFPDNRYRDFFDFFKLFKKFNGIHFDSSTIHFSSIDIPDVNLFFQDCTFVSDWTINSYLILEDVVSKTVFQNCIFQENVASSSMENARDILNINCHLFNDCEFKKKVIFNRGIYNKSIFNNSNEFKQKLPSFQIANCEFKAHFELNKAEIDELRIQDMEFEEKFELKNNNIKDAVISNVNFKKLFDAYFTIFEQLKISRSIFHDFAGFEKCQFGTKYTESDKPTEFEYVTFLNFTNFRKAKFFDGLDFEHTNLEKIQNFLNTEINFKNTNRETYRIIKYSFDKIGNQIEANKYFSYEMKKYKEELKNSNSKSELLIYRLNEIISDFGASYIKPALWMLGFAISYYLLVIGYEHNFLYLFDDDTNKYIDGFVRHMNLFAKGIPPYGKLLKEGMEFVTLLFHICFLTCTWQFIVAVKRRTKR